MFFFIDVAVLHWRGNKEYNKELRESSYMYEEEDTHTLKLR